MEVHPAAMHGICELLVNKCIGPLPADEAFIIEILTIHGLGRFFNNLYKRMFKTRSSWIQPMQIFYFEISVFLQMQMIQ